jgi:S-(hydroxymethyl)glutathione dehydrogenase/alcohol dehydrogenase
LDDPKDFEVLIELKTCGLCHSDHHQVTGDVAVNLPAICGHEGAGVVTKVGPGVSKVAVGDHVCLVYIPACGHCRWCARGRQYLCDQGAAILSGKMLDGTNRFHSEDGRDLDQVCLLGAFALHTVVPEDSLVKIPKDVPFEQASLLACRAATGWGAIVDRAETAPGDNVVVWGIGTVGASGLQAARAAGADRIFAVDLHDSKLEWAQNHGATDTLNAERLTGEEIAEYVFEQTNGVGADVTLLSVGVSSTDLIRDAYGTIAKGSTLVLVAVAPMSLTHMEIPITEMIFSDKQIKGCVYGSTSPEEQVHRLIALSRKGVFDIGGMITKRYSLEEVNEGYEDLLAGRIVAGVMVYE